MDLGAKVVDLIGLHLPDDPNQVGAVGEIAIAQNQEWVALIWILVKVINTGCIKLLALILISCTSYPFSSNSSAK